MGWTVILEDENNQVLSKLSEELIIENSDFTGFVLLKYLDPYGDTIFNRLQIDDLIHDLEILSNTSNLNFDELIALTKKCIEMQHTYVVFYGD